MFALLEHPYRIGRRHPTPTLMSPGRAKPGLLLYFATGWATAAQSSSVAAVDACVIGW